MNHGSLFSGIGGFELAAEWMGWENKFHCEWNEFGQKVLHHYWPESEQFTDIKKSNFTKYANKIDILTGGFPCQPYSSAGKRLGKDDKRHLWPEMLRAIREINPTYIVGENVRGLLNWNGGMVFNEVCAELETNGYQVAPCLIPACGVGAPHRRERIWFIAYSEFNGKEQDRGTIRKEAAEIWGEKESDVFRGCDKDGNATNAINERLQGSKFNGASESGEWERNESYGTTSEFYKNGNTSNIANTDCTNNKTRTQREILGQSDRKKTNGFGDVERSNQWQNFPAESPICGGNDGIPPELDGVTFPKWRNESIKGYGNAIVPQVALQIFKAIQKYDTENRCKP